MQPLVIASDLDGTLLGADESLSKRTRKALVAAREHGFKVVAVTARTPYGVDRLAELVPLIDTAICANGAVEYDPPEQRVTIWHSIARPTAETMCATFSEVLPEAAIAVETGNGIVCERRHYGDLLADMSRWEFAGSVEEMLAGVETIVKIKVYDPARNSEEMIAALDGHDLSDLDMCHWGDFGMLDFNARGANKATGLARWCSERAIGPEQVITFGDMPNDVPMLEWAGRSYAVAGAHPEALAAATGRTESNTEDGVAQVIEAVIDQVGWHPVTGAD